MVVMRMPGMIVVRMLVWMILFMAVLPCMLVIGALGMLVIMILVMNMVMFMGQVVFMVVAFAEEIIMAMPGIAGKPPVKHPYTNSQNYPCRHQAEPVMEY